jgi:hypothetical protein
MTLHLWPRFSHNFCFFVCVLLWDKNSGILPFLCHPDLLFRVKSQTKQWEHVTRSWRPASPASFPLSHSLLRITSSNRSSHVSHNELGPPWQKWPSQPRCFAPSLSLYQVFSLLPPQTPYPPVSDSLLLDHAPSLKQNSPCASPQLLLYFSAPFTCKPVGRVYTGCFQSHPTPPATPTWPGSHDTQTRYCSSPGLQLPLHVPTLQTLRLRCSQHSTMFPYPLLLSEALCSWL